MNFKSTETTLKKLTCWPVMWLIYIKELENIKILAGMFQAGLYPVSAPTFLLVGRQVRPDGRRQYTVADGVGQDRALMTKDPYGCWQTQLQKLEHGRHQAVHFVRSFHPSALSGNAGLELCVMHRRSLTKKMHIQFNVVSKETLLDAQKHPENYKSLVVSCHQVTVRFDPTSL